MGRSSLPTWMEMGHPPLWCSKTAKANPWKVRYSWKESEVFPLSLRQKWKCRGVSASMLGWLEAELCWTQYSLPTSAIPTCVFYSKPDFCLFILEMLTYHANSSLLWSVRVAEIGSCLGRCKSCRYPREILLLWAEAENTARKENSVRLQNVERSYSSGYPTGMFSWNCLLIFLSFSFPGFLKKKNIQGNFSGRRHHCHNAYIVFNCFLLSSSMLLLKRKKEHPDSTKPD